MATTDVRDLFKGNSKKKTSGITDVRDLFWTEESANEFYGGFQDRLTNWTNAQQSLISSTNDFYNNRDLSSYGLDGSNRWKETVSNRVNWLQQEADSIADILKEYGRYFDTETVNKIALTFRDSKNMSSNILKQADADIEFWNQFKGEEDYQNYYFNNKYDGKSYEEVLKALESSSGKEKDWLTKNSQYYMSSQQAQSEIDKLTKYKSDKDSIATELNNLTSQLKNAYTRAGYGSKVEEMVESDSRVVKLREQLGDYDKSGTANRIAELTEIKGQATLKEKNKAFEAEAENDPQYSSYWAKGRAEGTSKLIAYRNDPQTGYKESAQAMRAGGGSFDSEAWKFATHMEDDEYRNYLYFLGKYGEKKANEYLDSIETSVNTREANEFAKQYEGTVVLPQLFGLYAGVSSFGEDLKGLFSDGYEAPSSTQIASGLIREDQGAVGKVFYDIANTTGRQLPTILGTAVATTFLGPTGGQIVGAGLTGASSMGGARQEMLNLGYSNAQATTYGFLTGASEAGLQYVLGGIGKVGGAWTDDAVKSFTKGLNSAGAKFAIEFGADMVSEGIEEGLQEVLDPFFKKVATGKNEGVDWGQVAYSGFLGALSAGILNGFGASVNRAGEVSLANDIKKQGKVNTLKELGNTFAADTLANKLASKVTENTGAWKIADVIHEMRGELTEQNKADIKYQLVRNGMTESDADTVSEWLGKAVDGEHFTALQKKALDNNPIISRVFKKVIIDQNSTVNQRLQAMMDVQGIEGHAGVDYSAIAKAQSKEGLTASANLQQTLKSMQTDAIKQKFGIGRTALGDTDATLDSMVSEAKKAMSNAKVSESGVTTDSSTGKQINIKRVVDTNGKVATYAMADGSTIRSSNVEYANDDEGMLYEGAISLGYSADVTNGIIHGYQAVNMPVAKYLNGIDEAIEYGRIGYPMDKISNDGFYADLPDSMKKYAYDLGKESARKETDIAQADVDGFKGKADTVKEGKVVIRSKAALTERQKTSINTVGKVVSDITHNKVVFFDTVKKGNTLVFAEDVGGHKKGTKAPNGFHDKATGTIYIDINAGQNGEGVILWTAAHELTHFIRQWSPAKFKVLADFLMAEYGKKGVDIQALIDNKIAEARANKKTITRDKAYEEVVADSMQTMFTDTNLAEKLERLKNQDKGLWEKIKAFFRDLYKKIKEAYKGLDAQTEEARLVRDMGKTIERLSDLFAEAIVDAGETFQTASNLDVVPNTDAVRVEDTTEYSFRSLAQAAGFDAVEYEDGTKAFLRNGERVKKVTVADIENSPIGALINFSLEKGDIDEAHADEQKKMFARICTLANETNDFAMAMTFMGSAVFTGMKANSDKQYGTTYDFPSICTKTQAVIDAMSAKMKRLKRGLGADEMTKLYQEVFASGNPVPCPECYVFARWIGIGGLLDNINTYQDYYGEMGAEKAAVAYRKMYGEVEAFATENEITFGKAKGALASKVTKEYNDLKEKIEKADNQGEKVKDADRKKLSNLEKTMNTVKAMSWLEKVYFKGNPLTEQTPKVNPKYKVPTDILFDLNMGEAFATQYKEAWAFRTTQGAGYGKAITPYAEAVIGEGILVTNNTSKTIKDKQNEKLNNIFLEQKGTLTKDAKKALERARQKQKTQAFLGGQRFQSTSDARFENASDYLIAMLEMQAMGGMVQAYTKVDGAVPAFNAWGVSTNQSLMPKNGGVDANGNLIDTNTGGMNRDKAFENRKKYEQAGTITIGVNDIHIRVLFGEVERDFVIPYHASGGNAEMVAEFRRIQDKASKKETFVRSTDYTRVQSDKVLSDDVLSWLGKSDEDIERIKANREARIAILTGGSPNMDVVRESKYLSALYDKFAKGGEWEGVKLPKGKISSTIFPNEFWDKSVTYAESRKITEDYLAYCDELGFLHRFSGTVPSNGVLKPINGYDPNGNKVQLTDLAYKYDENGNKTSEVEPFYWKVLTDRRMYGNQGQYLEQKVITLNDTTEDTVTSFAKNNTGRQYDKELSMKTAEKIANEFSQEFKDSTVKGFGITDINSYIHVQKQVFRTLVNEGFFTDAENRSRTDVNEESGMVIETNKSGIDETFNDDNYGKRGKHLKYAKLATVRMIPEVIRSGHLVGDNVKNRHDGKRVRYAYIEQSVVVDGVPMTVKVDIRKSKDKNKMWVHSIYAEKISAVKVSPPKTEQ